MKKSQRDIVDSNRGITRRGLLLAGIQIGTVTTLALKMRSMQLDHADEYRMLADGNSIKIRLLPPSRGLILDRTGLIVAGNEQNYRVTLTREEAGGDVRALSLIHSTRILVIVTVAPLIMTLYWQVDLSQPPGAPMSSLPALQPTSLRTLC